jgi:hypothetical protein
MASGKLYRAFTGDLVVPVDYRLLDGGEHSWWGELALGEMKRIDEGDGYLLELADGRSGRCFLTRVVNKAVAGLLPYPCYRFRGSGKLAR